MKEIKYSELQNWKKQCIENELAKRPVLNENKLSEHKKYFSHGISCGFDAAILLLILHGYIETDFQN